MANRLSACSVKSSHRHTHRLQQSRFPFATFITTATCLPLHSVFFCRGSVFWFVDTLPATAAAAVTVHQHQLTLLSPLVTLLQLRLLLVRAAARCSLHLSGNHCISLSLYSSTAAAIASCLLSICLANCSLPARLIPPTHYHH